MPGKNHILRTVIILFVYGGYAIGQIVNFSDLELKRYLIAERCVDTTHNGVSFSNDRSADVSGDNEIQLSEALSVKAMELNDFRDNYAIKSLLDLNKFPNLNYLKVIDIDNLERISNMTLDSLKTLWISDGASMKKIDISNLPNITRTLRIEGITTLDTLNIQNGTNATQFSLFYSQNIQYACIDSIAEEINEFSNSGAMQMGVSPSFDCEEKVSIHDAGQINRFRIFPNPTSEFLFIESNIELDHFTIYTPTGKSINGGYAMRNNSIDVSNLENGLYIIELVSEMNKAFYRKFIKN